MKLYFRVHQQLFRGASYFVKWRTPTILQGDNKYQDLAKRLSAYQRILIVTDQSLMQLGLLDELLETLSSAQISYFIYDKTEANPTITNVEEAFTMFQQNHCGTVLAFGGGSPIDCAKVVSARLARPKKSIPQMKGIQTIRKKTLPVFVIPTTAGTGSETTIAAVITNDHTHEKYAISDLCLIPAYAVFCPELTTKMPPSITATTGMDALTHAIEAYLGYANTKQTKQDALTSIKLINENLLEAYHNGSNLDARKSMQYASFYAGKAFTRAYVGNVHAIAHALGGLYHLPHGLTNAIILPFVLRAYGTKIHKKLASIAEYIGIGTKRDNVTDKAIKVISWIEELNHTMGIPTVIKEIQAKDIPLLSKRAYLEANPTYPVPQIWSIAQFETMLYQLKGES